MTHAELRALLSAGTKGPWYLADWTSDDGLDLTTIEVREPEVLAPGQSSIWPDGIACKRVAETAEGERPLEDAALIVAAVNSLPALLDRVEALEAALVEARTWHEAADKAISKQPNANQGVNGWNRLQHQEQMELISAALKEKTQ